jgi:hypothetical protein
MPATIEELFFVVCATTVAMQHHGKHTSTTLEELRFLCGLCRRVINGTNLELSLVVRQWPASNCMSTEAEESPLLEAVARKRLKTLKAEKI